VISTVLASVHPFDRVLVGAVALLCVLVGWRLARAGERGRFLLRTLALLGALSVLLLTLSPSDAEPSGTFCTVQWSPLAPGVTGLANMVLFVPVSYFGGLATRRPFVVLAAAVGLSAAVEVLQGAIVPLGRACDTDDLWTNAVGALAGALLAWGTLIAARRTSPHRGRVAPQ
jgi:hypothetical protein